MSGRRRRVAGVLTGTTVVLLAAAVFSHEAAFWVLAGVAALLAAAYCVAALWLGRRAVRRDLDLAFGNRVASARALDWDQLDPRLRIQDLGGLAAEEPVEDELTASAVVRFMAAYFAALALTPLVILLQLISGENVDLERYDAIARLIRFQGYWRRQSLRMVTAGVAATATVTVVGATAGTAFAAPSYTVQAGDTLTQIANANGTTVSALAADNDLANPNLIITGQVLNLSGSTSTSAAAETTAATTYTVQPGDDLYRIALAHGTTWPALAAANNISNPNFIVAGQVLNLSGSASTNAPVQTAAATSYTVQPGDDLYAIATAHGTTWQALAAANNIANPTLIFPGEVLNLSGGGSASAPQPTATETSATSPSPSAASLAVQTALAQVGIPYVFGGASPSQGFDCSGLVMYAWEAAGVSLPHYSVAQFDDTTQISEDQLQPGDIVFYNNGEDVPQPGHEALYIGNGQVVAANFPGTSVQTQSLTWAGAPTSFGRVG